MASVSTRCRSCRVDHDHSHTVEDAANSAARCRFCCRLSDWRGRFASLGEKRVSVTVADALCVESGELAFGHALVTYAVLAGEGSLRGAEVGVVTAKKSP